MLNEAYITGKLNCFKHFLVSLFQDDCKGDYKRALCTVIG